MTPEPFGRAEELRAAEDFLERAADAPAGLALERPAGVGKTTLWSAVLRRARARGCRVLVVRAAPAELHLSCAALADLRAEVPDATLAPLPGVQRDALEAALLRAARPRRRGPPRPRRRRRAATGRAAPAPRRRPAGDRRAR